jgi:leucine-rich repeat protein SHOC2
MITQQLESKFRAVKQGATHRLNLSGFKLDILVVDTILNHTDLLSKVTILQMNGNEFVSENMLNSLPEIICRFNNLTELYLSDNQIVILEDFISTLTNLKHLRVDRNELTTLTQHIGKLSNLTDLDLSNNQLTDLPESIGSLTLLDSLQIAANKLNKLPESIFNLSNLTYLDLSYNEIMSLSGKIENLDRLKNLFLNGNKLTTLPASIVNLDSLKHLELSENPITDLSILLQLPQLETLWFFHVRLPRRYWTKFSEWKADWLLDETNAEIKSALIQQIGYERLCKELDAREISNWMEYSLLRIDNIQIIYQDWQEIGRDPMLLLKMTCPSTGHIHILRVPPEMTNAEAAITWVNHGIHPSKFSVQT